MDRQIVSALLACILGAPLTAQDVEQGRETYRQYCAACHGREARGDGPIAEILVIKPSNLRGLSAGNNGVFPTRRVVTRIDGRDPLLAHGAMMPIYGHIFTEQDTAMKAETGQPILTSAPIVDLVAYLNSVQE